MKRVAHRPRKLVAKRNPVHVTLRLVAGLPSLRQRVEHQVLRDALRAGSDRFGFRLVHYSAQSNHLHLVCEADDRPSLARGMQALAVRIARALNRLWRRTGALFADRYHARELETPTEVRYVLAYVLLNVQKHGGEIRGLLDPCSSAILFDGWKELRTSGKPNWLASAKTWLLEKGWKLLGPISIHARASPSSVAARTSRTPVPAP
jgi:REP element-mobilizing transposase RayT